MLTRTCVAICAIAFTTVSASSQLMAAVDDPNELFDVKVEFSEGSCSKEFPILVKVENTSWSDLTDITVVAFQRDPDRSRAACGEIVDFGDRIVKSGETYSACGSTLESRGGLKYNDVAISDEMAEDSRNMGPLDFSSKYGLEAYSTIYFFLSSLSLRNSEIFGNIGRIDVFGCRNPEVGMPWFGVVVKAKEFSEQ